MVTIWDDPMENYIITDARKREAARIYETLIEQDKKILVIEGEYGIGKTFLAKYYADKYRPVYPGGITYCAGIYELMRTAERWTEAGFPAERHLLVADELTEGVYWEEAEQRRLTDRFCELRRHSEHLDMLLLGNPVPAILAQSYPVLEVAPLSEDQARDIVMDRLKAYGQGMLSAHNYEALSRYYAYMICQNTDGNPRRIHNLMNLMEQENVLPLQRQDGIRYGVGPGGAELLTERLRGSKSSAIAAIPSIVDVNGNPLRSGSPEYGKLRTDLSCANEQVLRRLREHPDEICQMSPREFELFTAAMLERMGYRVELTPQTRDGGVDIYAARKSDIGSFLYLVQCKKQNPDRPVGVRVIRELYGVLQAEKATYASVFTTSYFSRPAKEFQEQFRHQLSLMDYQAIRDCLHRNT